MTAPDDPSHAGHGQPGDEPATVEQASVPGVEVAGIDRPPVDPYGAPVDGPPLTGAELAKRPSSVPVRQDDTQREQVARRIDPETSSVPLPTRRDARVGRPARHPEWMVNQLPVGMVQNDFFVRFVSIFQELGGSILDNADNLEHIPDLTVTPLPLVHALASWINAEAVDASLPEDLQRGLLAKSGKAMAHRGTARGLQEYLEMLSGSPATVVDGGGIWAKDQAPEDVAWVRMSVEGTGHLSEDEFVRMVRHQVPAHVRAQLWIDSRKVLDTSERDLDERGAR